MMRSGTIRRPRKSAVVVANEPMPSASKKLVPKPTPICSGVGKRASVAGLASGFPLLGAPRLRHGPCPESGKGDRQGAERREKG